jgi:hypothetical protein
MRLARATLFALLAPAAAFAANAGPSRQESFLSSPAHQRDSAEQLKSVTPTFFPGCTNVSISPQSFAILNPIEFDDRGIPRVGLWKEIFDGDGCGRSRKLTLYWGTDAKGDLHAALGAPGTTLTDLASQKVAIRQAVNAAAAKYPDCPSGAIDDTRFDMVLMLDSKPGAPPITNAWREFWVVTMCGHMVDVPLDFVQSGTTLDISAQTAGVTDHK